MNAVTPRNDIGVQPVRILEGVEASDAAKQSQFPGAEKPDSRIYEPQEVPMPITSKSRSNFDNSPIHTK